MLQSIHYYLAVAAGLHSRKLPTATLANTLAVNTVSRKADIGHQKDLPPMSNSSNGDLLPADAVYIPEHKFRIYVLASKLL